jgi:paraquat-inducible protein B
MLSRFKQYQDIDTGKYVRDKMDKIASYTLGDIIDDDAHNYMTYAVPRSRAHYDKVDTTVSNIIKFVPKDNDWDMQEALEAERKKKQQEEIIYQRQVAETELRLESERRHAEILRRQREVSNHCKVKQNSWIVKR